LLIARNFRFYKYGNFIIGHEVLYYFNHEPRLEKLGIALPLRRGLTKNPHAISNIGAKLKDNLFLQEE